MHAQKAVLSIMINDDFVIRVKYSLQANNMEFTTNMSHRSFLGCGEIVEIGEK